MRGAQGALDYIKFNLNLGNVTQPSDGYFDYAVSARSEILILFQLFNGRLLLNKSNQRFKELWCNKINSAYGVNLFYAGPGNFEGFANATLSGLTDSDGSFGLTIKENGRVITTWYFDQSFEKPYLDYMCSVLGVGRVEQKS